MATGTKMSEAERLLREGMAFEEARQYDKALVAHRAALRVDPGYGRAMDALGWGAYEGWGSPSGKPDRALAEEWFWKAIASGHPRAVLPIALIRVKDARYERARDLSIFRDIGGSAELFPRAEARLEDACRTGTSLPRYYIGILHEFGLGTPVHPLRALNNYKVAAEGGCASAKRAMLAMSRNLPISFRRPCRPRWKGSHCQSRARRLIGSKCTTTSHSADSGRTGKRVDVVLHDRFRRPARRISALGRKATGRRAPLSIPTTATGSEFLITAGATRRGLEPQSVAFRLLAYR